MNSETKKISFGFSKLAKKPSVLPQSSKSEKSIELIECLEGSEIKVKNAIPKIEKEPLVIAIKGSANNLIARIEKESYKNKKIKTEEENEDTRPDSELTIEELAARQLLKEARNRLTQEKDTTKVHTLPLSETLGALDAEEPSIGDYESVPINDYGLAMLRGMGWTEGMCVGRNQSKYVKPPEPDLRPKGLGLGAQKMVNAVPKDVFDKNGKQLVLAKGAFARIIAGSHKGSFCEVEGLNDETGRIDVKVGKTNEILSLNELFVTPITKEDYILGLKVINNAKYEEYKEKEVKVDNGSKEKSFSENKADRSDRSRPDTVKVKREEELKQDEEYRTSFTSHQIKYIREDSSNGKKFSNRREKYFEDSAKGKCDIKGLKTRDEIQNSSRHRSKERRKDKEYSMKYRKTSSEDSTSEEEYNSKKNSSKNKKKRDSSFTDEDSSYSDSISSEEERNRSKKMKSKKSKKHRDRPSSSEYKSGKSRNERENSKLKSKNHSKCRRESSSDGKNYSGKYRGRR